MLTGTLDYKTKEANLPLRINSEFTGRPPYVIFLKHIHNGWLCNYHGNLSNLNESCSEIKRYLGSDGVDFTDNMGNAFKDAWDALANGRDTQDVKESLQAKIDCAQSHYRGKETC